MVVITDAAIAADAEIAAGAARRVAAEALGRAVELETAAEALVGSHGRGVSALESFSARAGGSSHATPSPRGMASGWKGGGEAGEGGDLLSSADSLNVAPDVEATFEAVSPAPTLITEHEVAFATAAAALVPSPTMRWWTKAWGTL